MQSSLIGKVEKAKRYAEEPERVTISNFSAEFRGENDSQTRSARSGAAARLTKLPCPAARPSRSRHGGSRA